ncbi:hypothetical protein Tco_1353695 [Tanacetum coccineum]
MITQTLCELEELVFDGGVVANNVGDYEHKPQEMNLGAASNANIPWFGRNGYNCVPIPKVTEITGEYMTTKEGWSVQMLAGHHVQDLLKECLSINLSKSKLLGVVVSEDRVVQAANRIGCGILKAPFAYLGSKVRGNMSRIKSWDEIVDKMVDRLSKWKMKTLSIAILAEDGKMSSGFKVGYKIHLAKHSPGVETLQDKRYTLKIILCRKCLSNGADTYFWEDLWHGDMVLKQRYPRLYALEVKKTVDVASKLSQENLTWSFRRAPRSGVEQDQLKDLTTYVRMVMYSPPSPKKV